MTPWLDLYHRLPAPARNVAASLRGAYLNRWRYGPESTSLMAAALERDHWTDAQWRAWHEERLAFILQRAATRVPWYRAHWNNRRRHGDHASWDQLANWPVLDKDRLRESPHAFVADDCDPRRMYHEQTSGTTGKALDIWRTRDTVRALYAVSAARTLTWDGVPPHTRWARLGGQLVIPTAQQRPPFWVWNASMRQLYLSSFHLSPALIPSYLDALVRYRIGYLAGYPSSLVALAQSVLALGRTDLAMRVVYTNAEPLSDEQRRCIGQAFQCPVRQTYGMTEFVAAGSECPGGSLHQWPEIGHVEVAEGDELLCTGLLNADMPLIRYRVGDRGRLAPPGAPCSCGRTLPVIERVDGRTSDLLLTRDGRRIFWLNPVFYGLPVRESQIIQDSYERLRVLVARAEGFDARTAATIAARLRARVGEMHVDMEYVEAVPRTSNGKVRAVVCRLSPLDAPAANSAAPAAAAS